MELPSRAAIVATARESIVRGSKSFAAASSLFDRTARERSWLLYAWCRRCDDLADGQDHGHDLMVVPDPAARLARIGTMTNAALANEVVGDPAFDALRIVVSETRLPAHFVRDLVDGFRLDLENWRPRSEPDLFLYCYHVAGVVGCMMAVVMGVSPDDAVTLDRACDLGMAFQLANIARDIKEDGQAGRCYIPEDWLEEMNMPADQLLSARFRPQLAIVAQRLADRAAVFEESARLGTPRLSLRSAWAVLAAAGIYGDIGRAVAAQGEHAWDRRVTTSTTAKLRWILRAGFQALQRARIYPERPRETGLWARPRG